MKAKYIQTKLIHLNKACWIKLNPTAFKQCLLNQMKAKCIQTMLIKSNESQVHSNKVNWFLLKAICI